MISPNAQPWRAGAAGIKVLVRVTPKAPREGVDSLAETAQGPAVIVRVRAAADKGEANRATEMVVAAWLGIAKSRVAVAAGGKSRFKTLTVAGDAAELEGLLAKRLAELGAE